MPEQDPRLERLREIVRARAVLHGEFVLSSGERSTYYFDGRRVTHDQEGIALIGELVCDAIGALDIQAVGGPASAANPIVTATQLAAWARGTHLPGFYVRAEQKAHGTQRLVEGNLPEGAGTRVAVVDDTLTTGSSIEGAARAVEAAGCMVGAVVVVVDRRQGGLERLQAQGYDVRALMAADGPHIA